MTILPLRVGLSADSMLLFLSIVNFFRNLNGAKIIRVSFITIGKINLNLTATYKEFHLRSTVPFAL